MKDQEKIRIVETALLLSGVALYYLLENQDVNAYAVANLMGLPYALDVISSFKT